MFRAFLFLVGNSVCYVALLSTQWVYVVQGGSILQSQAGCQQWETVLFTLGLLANTNSQDQTTALTPIKKTWRERRSQPEQAERKEERTENKQRWREQQCYSNEREGWGEMRTVINQRGKGRVVRGGWKRDTRWAAVKPGGQTESVKQQLSGSIWPTVQQSVGDHDRRSHSWHVEKTKSIKLFFLSVLSKASWSCAVRWYFNRKKLNEKMERSFFYWKKKPC